MKPKPSPSERLTEYRAKRSAEKTSEPFGTGFGGGQKLFVVQMHAARRLHWDLRLEFGGTLLSWAVPNGFTTNVGKNHFAARTEDHPIEYADFEGVIPEGNYGAGSVIVWDRGHYEVLNETLEAGLAGGAFHVVFYGYKLRGEFILVETSKEKREWLLRKARDEWSIEKDIDPEPYDDHSVLSGLTVEDLTSSGARVEALTKSLTKAKAPKRVVEPDGLELMLADTGDKPFSNPKWLYELKYDGYRMLAFRNAAGVARLRSRGGHDITRAFPEIARAVAALPYPDILLDGELVVLDDDGKPNFHHLQVRSKLSTERDVAVASVQQPATFFAFDLLGAAGFDMRKLPLIERKAHLETLVPKLGAVRYADHILEHGEAMFEQVKALDVEGIMAKQAASPYIGKRSERWLKLVHLKTVDLAVAGYTKATGNRKGFGALHCAFHDGKQFVYSGRVGGGFTEADLEAMGTALEAAPDAEPPAGGPRSRTNVWIEPTWVVEVRFKEWTPGGTLRQPVFLGVRDDKRANECGDGPRGTREIEPAEIEVDAAPAGAPDQVEVSRPEKLFWPEDGYTKGDLVAYYRAVSPWLLPVLKDRPIVLTRYPDGIHGKSFYQKNAPAFIPEWIETVPIWSEGGEKDVNYIVCQNEASLVYLANSGAIPLHIWPSRRDRLQHPDWCILDLDPKGAPFKDVITLAKAIRKLAKEIGLPTAVKTSGSTGLHVLVPLGGQCTFDQSRVLGQLISTVIERRHPDISTTARVVEKRKGKVYLDFLQNRHGQLLVTPYSVRPLPGAPVSAPLRWTEVTSKLTPQQFTIKNILPRLKRQKADPFDLVLTERPDLVGALEKLQALFADE
jgi:bifunctional non-homologous end joining protein LigD